MFRRIIRWFFDLTPQPIEDPNYYPDIEPGLSIDDILLRLGMEDGYNPTPYEPDIPAPYLCNEGYDEDNTNNFDTGE